VGELPLETQVKLLRVLQEREFEPVGSSKSMRVDVRVIAATNRDLQEAVAGGRFRSDLYYRLNVFPVRVPPLRERASDVPQLAMFFLGQYGKTFGRRIERMSEATIDRLVRYPWPGNVRELQNVIERAVVLCQGSVLDLDEGLLPATESTTFITATAVAEQVQPDQPSAGHGTLEEMERAHILATLEKTGWLIEGVKGAAKILAIHPNTLRSRMEKLAIKRPRHGIS